MKLPEKSSISYRVTEHRILVPHKILIDSGTVEYVLNRWMYCPCWLTDVCPGFAITLLSVICPLFFSRRSWFIDEVVEWADRYRDDPMNVPLSEFWEIVRARIPDGRVVLEKIEGLKMTGLDENGVRDTVGGLGLIWKALTKGGELGNVLSRGKGELKEINDWVPVGVLCVRIQGGRKADASLNRIVDYAEFCKKARDVMQKGRDVDWELYVLCGPKEGEGSIWPESEMMEGMSLKCYADLPHVRWLPSS
jgi:hypothetical protein